MPNKIGATRSAPTPRLRTVGRSTTGLTRVVVLLVVLQLAVRMWALQGLWFLGDDLILTRLLSDTAPRATAVTQGYNGHLMPAGMLIHRTLIDLTGPLRFGPFAVVLGALQVLATLGTVFLLRTLFGWRWGIVPPLVVALFAVTSLPAVTWWAAGINQFALLIALGWGLSFHVLYLRTGAWRWLLATLAVLAVCLLCYEKVLLAPVALFGISFWYFAEGSPWRRLIGLCRTWPVAMGLHTLLVAGYLLAYVALAAQPADGSSVAGAGVGGWAELAWNLGAEAYATAMVGGPLGWYDFGSASMLADPGPVYALGAVVLGGVLIAGLHRRYAYSLRAWSLPAVFLLLNLVLLGTARAAMIGPQIGLEYRYLVELGLVTAVALGAAWMPIVGAVQQPVRRAPAAAVPESEPESESEPEPEPPIAAVSVGCVVVLVCSLLSTVAYVRHVHRADDRVRDYVTTVDRTLRHAEGTRLVAAELPSSIVWGVPFAEGSTQAMLAPLQLPVSYPDASVDELAILDLNGELSPIDLRLDALATATDTACGRRIAPGESRRIALQGPVAEGRWLVRVTTWSRAGQRVAVRAGETTRTLRVPRGMHHLWVWAEGSFGAVRVRTDPTDPTGPPGGLDDPGAAAQRGPRGRQLCVPNVWVGQPFAATTPPDSERTALGEPRGTPQP